MAMDYETHRNATWIRLFIIILLLVLLDKYQNGFLYATLGFCFADWLEDSLKTIRLLEEEKEKPSTWEG